MTKPASYYGAFYGEEAVKRLTWIREQAPWDPDDRTSESAQHFPFWELSAVLCATLAWHFAQQDYAARERQS